MIRLAVNSTGEQTAERIAAMRDLPGACTAVVVGADDPATRRLADALGAPAIVARWDVLLDQHADTFDALVDWRSMTDGALLSRAAQLRKHALVRGPFDLEASQAHAVAQAGVHCQIVWPLREMPYQRTVRQSLDDGKLGRPGLVRLHHWKSVLDTELDSVDHREADTNEERRLAIDEIDVACWLLGDWPESVYACALPGVEQATSTGVQVHLGFAGGGMALIDVARRADAGAADYFALSLIGSDGAAYADDHHNTNLVLNRHGAAGLPVSQGDRYPRQRLEAFVTAVASDVPSSEIPSSETPSNDVAPRDAIDTAMDDSRRALAVADAVRASSTSGRAYCLRGGVYVPR